ncbi:hypothetical protein BDW42DRAFT_936 [Aspergillus taichungensis]|uniref:F-box domain-containing protein n=1 Tax=Aspergillus taichungensis TaxID=482145 RepID=A0A2J5IAA1_9EURO|nr:hypothetical protein BDW42DRAFT_936 [Aspergillus taichungensis]
MESLPQCAICCGEISHEGWTKYVKTGTVLLKDNRIDLGSFLFRRDVYWQESRSDTASGGRTQIRIYPEPYHTSTDVFLMHLSCHELLLEFAGSDLGPHETFKLCQAILPDRDRIFGHDLVTKSSICPDPCQTIRPLKCLLPSERTELLLQPGQTRQDRPSLLRLPSEILVMILAYLSPSDLAWFFRTSKEALSYADIFCRTSPLRTVGHSFGFRESFVDIPDHAKMMEVCSIVLDDERYVCGIGFVSRKLSVFCGHRTKCVQQVRITNPRTDTIEMAVDALGVRSIKYGDAPWLGDPSVTRCWRGLSLREKRPRIRIVHDALKFRDLSWERKTAPSFPEIL